MTTPQHPPKPQHVTSPLSALQHQIWRGALPLEVRLAAADCRTFNDSEPYLVLQPRLSYLAFLLPRLHAFFRSSLINPQIASHEAWLEFQGVPLKWHYPAGLLFDLFAGVEPFSPVSASTGGPDLMASVLSRPTLSSAVDLGAPWKLVIHYTDFPHDQLIALDADGLTIRDWFVNAVKEADYIRNGNARPVMSLSREDSDNLWRSVQTHDIRMFNSVHDKLLSPPGVELKHIPVRFYLPTITGAATVPGAPTTETIAEETNDTTAASAGHFRVVQSLIPLHQSGSRLAQTLGTALNAALPSVFPSRRNPLLAQPVLHGAEVPMSANLLDLSRAAAYTDGFLHIIVSMLG